MSEPNGSAEPGTGGGGDAPGDVARRPALTPPRFATRPFRAADSPESHRSREHRRRRLRRRGRRAYIRSVYFLPSLATLGNAICGFGCMYVAGLASTDASVDPLTRFFSSHRFIAACYLIFLAMLFDAIDGRLARFTRHTTDFGGQLDSLADVISFGVAPAFLALQVFKNAHPIVWPMVDRLFWAVGALYMSCAALRLARFNVSNEHGEQHHFSFLGLPSPGAGGAVVAFILMQQDLLGEPWRWAQHVSDVCIWMLPPLVLAIGLLMVSNIRYPHVVNRYMRGRRSLGRLLLVLVLLLLLVVAHRYVLAVGTVLYAFWGPISWLWIRARRKAPTPR